MYIYNEEELLEFFGSEPLVSDEFGHDISYAFDDGTHRLVFGFNVDTSDCSVQVFKKDNPDPLLSFVYLDSPGVKVVSAKSAPYLEVGAPNSAPGSTKEWFVPSEGLRIKLKPNLLVESFRRG